MLNAPRSNRAATLLTGALTLALVSCGGPLTPDPGSEGTTHQAFEGAGTFEPVGSFGTNPGALDMYRYVPSPVPPGPAPLVLALHGCSQTAADYRQVGWEPLADALGFYVVYPAQRVANNGARCFNWYGELGDTSNLERGKGENQSIVEMVQRMEADYSIDTSRVYIMGLSAGGAQTALMLATWPDVFAGGGIIAGVPYACSTQLAQVPSCLSPGIDKTPKEQGDLVRGAVQGFPGPFPRVTIWAGSSDLVVNPNNQRELMEQWTDVHGIDTTPDVSTQTGAATRAGYADSQGNVLVETVRVANAPHGSFVDPDHGCGATGTWAVDFDVCAASSMASFWGLEAGSSGGTGTGGTTSSGGNGQGGVQSSGGSGGLGTQGGNPSTGGGGTSHCQSVSTGGACSPGPNDPGQSCDCALPGSRLPRGNAPGSRSLVGFLMALMLLRRRAD